MHVYCIVKLGAGNSSGTMINRIETDFGAANPIELDTDSTLI